MIDGEVNHVPFFVVLFLYSGSVTPPTAPPIEFDNKRVSAGAFTVPVFDFS